MMPDLNWPAWVLAALGSACSVYAAYLTGGQVAALGAAGTAFFTAAGILGWTGKPKANA